MSVGDLDYNGTKQRYHISGSSKVSIMRPVIERLSPIMRHGVIFDVQEKQQERRDLQQTEKGKLLWTGMLSSVTNVWTFKSLTTLSECHSNLIAGKRSPSNLFILHMELVLRHGRFRQFGQFYS